MKLLCTADLHLGRRSGTLKPLDSIDVSAEGAWRRAVDLALIGKADAVLLAGDVFDHEGTYYAARRAFADGLDRLRDAGVEVLAVAGNHDWKSLPAFAAAFPNSGLRLLGPGGEWSVVELQSGLRVAGWSFPSPCARAWAGTPPTADLGVVHGELASPSRYHPLPLQQLTASAMPWLLGHVHLPSELAPLARYPGSPQALDFGPGELGAHGVCWLERIDRRWQFGETVATSSVRFDVQDVVCESEDVEEAVAVHLAGLALPGVESVQWRGRVIVRSGARPMSDCSSPVLAANGRDVWWATSVLWEPPTDWEEQSRAPGIKGRLADWWLQLTGARPESDELTAFLDSQALKLTNFNRRSFEPCVDRDSESQYDVINAHNLARGALLQAIEARVSEEPT